MSQDCDQEMCPMWDGCGCPCERFGLDPDELPTSGVFTITALADEPIEPTTTEKGTQP